MTEKITLERLRTSEQGTFGILKRRFFLTGSGEIVRRIAATCELPWHNNKNQISCIPKGVYEVERWHSKKYPDAFHVKNVPGREAILIHHGNTIKDIRGCILVGTDFGYVGGISAVLNSRVMLKALLNELPEKFTLEIVGVV